MLEPPLMFAARLRRRCWRRPAVVPAILMMVPLLSALLGGMAWLYFADEPARVLVVHSYDTDLAWVNDVDHGIDRALQQSGLRVQLRRLHLNLLNHPDCAHLLIFP